MSVASYGTGATREAASSLNLETLYRDHAEDVARWTAHLGGPAIDVEDVVHEVFLCARRALPDFRGESQPSTWLYRITARVVRDLRRKERFRRWIRQAKRDQIENALTAPLAGPADEIERRQAISSLYGVLDKLPEKYRQLLILFELEEMSGEEIAALTGINLSTVWVRLHRARERFRAAIERLDKESR